MSISIVSIYFPEDEYLLFLRMCTPSYLLQNCFGITYYTIIPALRMYHFSRIMFALIFFLHNTDKPTVDSDSSHWKFAYVEYLMGELWRCIAFLTGEILRYKWRFKLTCFLLKSLFPTHLYGIWPQFALQISFVLMITVIPVVLYRSFWITFYIYLYVCMFVYNK